MKPLASKCMHEVSFTESCVQCYSAHNDKTFKFSSPPTTAEYYALVEAEQIAKLTAKYAADQQRRLEMEITAWTALAEKQMRIAMRAKEAQSAHIHELNNDHGTIQ